MRRIAILLVLSGLMATTSWSADQDGGVSLQGAWRLEERKSVVRFDEVDGGWDGRIEASERPREVGFMLFRSLHLTRPGELKGALVMPENGSTHEVVVRVKGDDAKAVVGAWIFTKTLELKRVK